MKIYRTPNNKTVYKQFNSKWGYLPYPILPSTLAGAGCGCCSITHCAIELFKYMDYTPKKVQPFMKHYAKRGRGTLWTGIDEGLKHYGFKNVKRVKVKDINKLWLDLETGNKIGILVFNKNVAPNGVQWTTGGHYIAFLGYKKSNNGEKHWLYTKDSGGKNHDGWYCYETSMKNCIRGIWVCEVPTENIVLPKIGHFQLNDASNSVKIIQGFLKSIGLYKGKIGGHYRFQTRKAVKKFQQQYKLSPINGKWDEKCTKKYLELTH